MYLEMFEKFLSVAYVDPELLSLSLLTLAASVQAVNFHLEIDIHASRKLLNTCKCEFEGYIYLL